MSTQTARLVIVGAGVLLLGSWARQATPPGQPPPPEQPPAAAPAAPKEDKKGAAKKGDSVVKVSIEVKSETGPLADAVVLIKQAGGFERNSSTNSTGIARFTQVPRGKTTVQITAAGFKPHTSQEDLAAPESTLQIKMVKQ